MYFAAKCASKHHQSASKALSKYIKALQSSSKHFKALQFSKLHFDRLWWGLMMAFPNKRRFILQIDCLNFLCRDVNAFIKDGRTSTWAFSLKERQFYANHCHHHYGQPCTYYVHMHVQQTTAAPWPLLKKQWIIESIEFIWVKQTYWVFVTNDGSHRFKPP